MKMPRRIGITSVIWSLNRTALTGLGSAWSCALSIICLYFSTIAIADHVS